MRDGNIAGEVAYDMIDPDFIAGSRFPQKLFGYDTSMIDDFLVDIESAFSKIRNEFIK